MSVMDSDEDLTIDIGNGDEKYDPEDIYSPLPSTSSNSKTQIHDVEPVARLDKAAKLDLATESNEEMEMTDSSDGSDSESVDRCAICLGRLKGKIGSPEAPGCEHYFCLLCILEWAKNNPVCPQDRRPFERVLVREEIGGEITSKIVTTKEEAASEDPIVENPTYCEVCGSSEREYCLLLCDGCDLGYHLECLTPPLSEVPIEEWFCPLCATADLPEIVNPGNVSSKQSSDSTKASGSSSAVLGNDSSESKRTKKRKEKTEKVHRSRARMIPRTRASERVLQRISQTRKKEDKKFRKKELKARKKEIRAAAVQAFHRARPFGSVSTDDIDAAFNEDEYADRLLDSASTITKTDKKTIAFEKLKNTGAPSPSYGGRTIHPKINELSQSDSTDLLSNILEDQFVLLSSSKNIALTEERKLTKLDGVKTIEYDVDMENLIMSKPLPSQRKAKENDEPPIPEESSKESPGKSSSSSADISSSLRNKKHYPNGYSDPKRDSHSYRSHSGESKHHRNSTPPKSESAKDLYHQSFRRRERSSEREYHSRSRDSRRRERSRSRDRKRSYGREKYEPRHHSSRSRDKRRTESSKRRHSRSPDRCYRDRKRLRSRSRSRSSSKSRSTKSFWGKSFSESSKKDTTPFSESKHHHNISLHSMSIPSPQPSSLFDKDDKMLSAIPENNSKDEMLNSLSTKESSNSSSSYSLNAKDNSSSGSSYSLSIDPQSSSCSEKAPKSKTSLSFLDKGNLQSLSEAWQLKPKQLLSSKSDSRGGQKQKFKNLFGDDASESGSPVIDVDISGSEEATKNFNFKEISTSRYSSSDKQADTRKRHVSPAKSKPSPDQFNKDSDSMSDTASTSMPFLLPKKLLEEGPAEQKIKGIDSPQDEVITQADAPASPDIPNLRLFNTEEDLESITTFSQASRDFILDSLFGKKRHLNLQASSDQSLLNKDNQNTKKDNLKITERNLTKLELSSKTDEKDTIHPLPTLLESRIDGKLIQDVNKMDRTQSSAKRKTKLFDNLFGDSSDMEVSDSDVLDFTPPKSCDKSANKYPKLEKEVMENPRSESPKIQDKYESRDSSEEIASVEKTKVFEAIKVGDGKNALPVPKIKANKVQLETKVVEEAKRFLNPYYQDKAFSKEVYKEIISKCVNKVLEVECSHTIEPKKIQKLVDGYVQVYQHRNKKSSSQKNL